jgi:hypothetical protein
MSFIDVFGPPDPSVAQVDTNWTIPNLGDSFSLGDIFGGGSSSTGGGPIVAPPVNMPSTSGGMSDLFKNITGLVQSVYQGEQAVQTAQLQNKIATARLNNQLETVKTTPNVWAVLGLGAAAVFVLALAERGK